MTKQQQLCTDCLRENREVEATRINVAFAAHELNVCDRHWYERFRRASE